MSLLQILNMDLIDICRCVYIVEPFFWSYLCLQNVGSEELEKRTKAMFCSMAVSFPHPVKAEESFHKLDLIEDSTIFCMLEELLNAETSADAHSTKVRSQLYFH